MIRGRFGGPADQPYIEGLLDIASPKVRGHVRFLVDTGADQTILMPADADRLGVNHTRLKGEVITVGVGGAISNYSVPASVSFVDSRIGLHVYDIGLLVAVPAPHVMRLPSLLGRNILNRWTLTFDMPNRRLFAVPASADRTRRLATP
jgi:predicted aspartyl protease